jgi:3-phenylpropionate/trans-cinnamate dioxygenase ferredoxin reductase subunit
MLGATTPYDVLPYFYSDQYDVGMEYTGYVDMPDGYDDVVISGSTADRELVAFWVRDGEVQAGMAVNVWERIGDIEGLVRSRERIARKELEGFVGA